MDKSEQLPEVIENLDPQLRRLVHLANRYNIEVSVTVISGGQAISGQIIGGKKFFELYSNNLADAWPSQDGKEEIREAFRKGGEIYDDISGSIPLPQYIHIEHARIISPYGQTPTGGDGLLWRGRISQITGFCLGSISSSSK